MAAPKQGEPRFWFALAAEDADHHAAVTRLTARALGDLSHGWRARTPFDAYWKVTGAESAARTLGLPLRGHFGGKRELESAMFRAQLLLWQHAHIHGQRIDVGFLARDTDHKPRKDGALLAKESGAWPFAVVLVLPHPEIEAWKIAVFEPVTRQDKKRLKDLTRRLGFSPVAEPHRLTSTVHGAATDAKTVADELFEDGWKADEWLEVDLDALRALGKTCGLADFLGDLDALAIELLKAHT
jgi:hypothetical protein